MTESEVGFLYNIVSKISTQNDILKKLKSHYLMRCNEITRSHSKLPEKQFSHHVRCPHCYSDWTRDSVVQLKPVKLSKKQRQKVTKHTKNNVVDKKYEMNKNEITQTCTFCHKSTTTLLTKPMRNYNKPAATEPVSKVHNETTLEIKTVNPKKNKKIKNLSNSIAPQQIRNDFTVNVYTNAHDVFSLKNDKNTLASTVKPASKVIKNNKKRKDKFAGLCQKAVLASAKLKQDKEVSAKKSSDSKLSLFLKPSSG